MKLIDALRDDECSDYECTNYHDEREDRLFPGLYRILIALAWITGPLTIAAQIWHRYHHR